MPLEPISSTSESPAQRLLQRHGVLLFAVLSTLLCCGAAIALGSHSRSHIFDTANKLGNTAENLVQGHGLAICYGPQDTAPCFYAQRMPVAPVTLAILYEVFGDSFLSILVKIIVFLVPIIVAFTLIWKRTLRASSSAQWGVSIFFLACLALPPTLDLTVNLNFEEAYFYGWFALAVALLFFADSWRAHSKRWAAVFSFCLSICFLTKSSLLPAVCVLALSGAMYAWRSFRRPGLALFILCITTVTPLFWGLRQLHTSGRFSVGTSLDGVNLLKGNNPFVLARYPAFVGASLDGLEGPLLAAHVAKNNEWQQDDYAHQAAMTYIHDHQHETRIADLRKASVFFLSVHRNLGDTRYSPLVDRVFTAGLVLFRLLLLTGIGIALFDLFTHRNERFRAAVFLGVVLATAAPYIIGFALTRHSLVLLLPAAIFLCRRCIPIAFSDSTP